MKQIIHGKKYDTETATMLGETWEGVPSDFRYYREELYRKKNGEFFLYGTGGAMSAYSQSTGDSVMGGERIIPYTESDAKEWAEKNLTVEEYENVFGEVEE